MRKTINVLALLLVLTSSTYGGDMPNGSPAPAPPPDGSQEETMSDSMMPEGGPESLTETVLNLLESVLALL